MATDLRSKLVEQGLFELLRARLQRTFPVVSPAAGAEWSQVVPGGVAWEIVFVRAAFVTSAVVATRIPELRFTDPDGVIAARVPPTSTQAASNATNHLWTGGLGLAQNTGGISAMGLPAGIVLPAGWAVRTTTFAIDVADQWSTIVLTVREWSPQQIAAQAAWLSRQLPTTYPSDEGGA